jgi:transcriptional regulator with XRE-family HTH domain
VAAALIRALRGKRSQAGLSKRLGYRSNIVQRWETAQCWPTAARFFSLCRRVGVDLDTVLARFHSPRPAWVDEIQLTSPAGVARWLRELKGKTPIGAVADAAHVSRFRVARWLKGEAQPRLPELLMMVDVSSGRLVDFVATLTDPAGVPPLAREHAMLQRAREAAYRHPWSQAVLRALELPQPKRGQSAWLAQTLGIEVREVTCALEVLEQSGQVTKCAGRYVAEPLRHINTSADPAQARALKRAWAEAAVSRLASGQPGMFGYALFAASREDLRTLRELQLQYTRQMQSLIAQSTSNECVGLFCVQLLDLSLRDDNALRLSPASTAASRTTTT